jgi:DNA helicase-2/ATP-dependent DNA helicase PcrA
MMENDTLLSALNESQREAVLFIKGPQLIVAGAGSGKTRVLTYKIAYLLEQGIQPRQIMALTFTNKAAREMKERIGRLVGDERARYLQMGTFHSIFARLLRYEADKIGYAGNFTIYDQSDSRSLIKNIIKEMGLNDKVYKPASVADRISMAKNHLVLPQAYAESTYAEVDEEKKHPLIGEIYRRYMERCRLAYVMDFDDLLLQTWVLLSEHVDVRKNLVERFKYILVDEYQDTNKAQSEILKLLYEPNKNCICAVGDDAQSIYSFRGATIDNILQFEKDFKGATKFLTINYRSTENIINAANSLISKNEFRLTEKPVIQGVKDEGDCLTLKPAYSDREEAIIVCQDIKRLRREENGHWSDFAILYRTNAQSRSFEEQMRKDNIPYRIYGGLSFYQRKEIKDVIAYFRMVANPDDEEAFKRIVNYPTRGIGNTTIDKIVSTANNYGVSLWRVISDPVLFPLEVNKGTLAKIDAFRQLIDGWRQRLTVEDAYQLGHDIIMTSGISRDIYGSHNPEDISRQENLEEFLSGMQDFVEGRREEDMGDQVYLTDFLQEVALLTDLDSDDGDDNDKVVLMTIHAAKGLEFPTVFVVGLEENIFPSPMCTNSMRELEEERRLLYVAITRAEKHCIMTCAQNRFRYGRMEYDTPSRFIKDFDPHLIRVVSETGGDSFGCSVGSVRSDGFSRSDGYTRGYGETTSRGSQWMQNPRPVATQFRADPKPRAVAPRQPEKPVEPFSDSFKRTLQTASGGRFRPVGRAVAPRPMASEGGTLTEGAVIEHQRFGVGRVMKLEGAGENQKATVEFKNAGTKQLLLKFARYKVIG